VVPGQPARPRYWFAALITIALGVGAGTLVRLDPPGAALIFASTGGGISSALVARRARALWWGDLASTALVVLPAMWAASLWSEGQGSYSLRLAQAALLALFGSAATTGLTVWRAR
jgi:hypothetical protein